MDHGVLVSSLEVRKSPHGDHQVIVINDCVQIDWVGTAARVSNKADCGYFSQVIARNDDAMLRENLRLANVLAFVADEELRYKPKGYNCVRFVANVVAECLLEEDNFM